jgi:hypothetical protein
LREKVAANAFIDISLNNKGYRSVDHQWNIQVENSFTKLD